MLARCRSLMTAGIVALVGATSLQSQGVSTETQAKSALDRMMAAYQSANALHVKVVWAARYTGAMSADDFQPPGPDVLELKMQRPNKLFMEASATEDGKRWRYMVVSDGTRLWYWRTAKNTYWETKAPATFAEFPKALPEDAIGTMTDSGWEIDSIMEWDLLTAERFSMKDEIAGGGLRLSITGPEQLRGATVHQVRMTASDGLPFTLESRIYLDVQSYVVRGLALVAHGKNPENGRDFSAEMQAAYEVFDVRPKFTAADFTFVPPPGAKRAGG